MPASEFDVGEAVLEGLPVEAEDVGIAPLVFAVAVAAQRPLHARVAAVQSASCLKILSDLFVATQAAVALVLAIEGGVTGSAIPLDLRMDFGDGAGHHELFEVEAPRIATQRQAQAGRNYGDFLGSHGISTRARPGRGRVLQ